MAVLRLFAAAREAAGTASDTVGGATIGDVLAEATKRYGPGFAAVLAIGMLAANIASTRPFKGAVSLAISVSNSKPSRTDMIAIPWTAIVPLMMILSPACARPG